jgi:hypothetical protein
MMYMIDISLIFQVLQISVTVSLVIDCTASVILGFRYGISVGSGITNTHTIPFALIPYVLHACNRICPCLTNDNVFSSVDAVFTRHALQMESQISFLLIYICHHTEMNDSLLLISKI